jgi:hypothetical protein
MADSGPGEQHNHGSGTFVGRDNRGIIVHNETLDQKTKTTMERLAALLRETLHIGFISPDVAEALKLVVQNINEDVADQLWFAGRNINENVAELLWQAGRNINENVANKFVQINDDLNDTVDRLDGIVRSLPKRVQQSSSLQDRSIPDRQFGPESTVPGAVSRTAGVVIQPSPRAPDKWRVRFGLICGSSAAGLVAAMILMRSHLGGQAVFVTVVMVVAAVALLVKVRR